MSMAPRCVQQPGCAAVQGRRRTSPPAAAIRRRRSLNARRAFLLPPPLQGPSPSGAKSTSLSSLTTLASKLLMNAASLRAVRGQTFCTFCRGAC